MATWICEKCKEKTQQRSDFEFYDQPSCFYLCIKCHSILEHLKYDLIERYLKDKNN